jgi:ferredoxin
MERPLRYNARDKGICGTCKSKLISGTVEMQHAGGVRPREIRAGMRLLCGSQPSSDRVIDREETSRDQRAERSSLCRAPVLGHVV